MVVCVLSSVQTSAKSSAELCTELSIKDVDLEWSDADYENLTTFSIFARMVRPQLMAVGSHENLLCQYLNLVVDRYLIQLSVSDQISPI